MVRLIQRWSLAAVPFLAVACSEVAEPSLAQPQGLDVFIPELAAATVTDGRAPTDGMHLYTAETDPPPEFDEPPAILDTQIDTDLTSTYASGDATMRFWGNAAEQTLRLLLRFDGGAAIGDQTRQGQFHEVVPGIYELSTTGAMTVSRDCGHKLEAFADYKAWHQYGTAKWGLRTENDTNLEWQAACPDEGDDPNGGDDGGDGDGDGGGGGGGGDDAGWSTCYGTAYYQNGVWLYTDWHYCEEV